MYDEIAKEGDFCDNSPPPRAIWLLNSLCGVCFTYLVSDNLLFYKRICRASNSKPNVSELSKRKIESSELIVRGCYSENCFAVV